MAVNKKPKVHILCPQGKTFSQPIRLANKFQTPIRLGEYTARVEVRTAIPVDGINTAADAEVLYTLTTENGGITIEPELGRVVLFIDAATTATFPAGTYFWELELINPDNYIPYIMQPSKFVVTKENTLNAN